jgi:hypothetical protein
MKESEKQQNDNAQWETIEALESIANMCIYKGKDVAKARALLKSVYQKDLEYDDTEKCLDKEPS